MIIDHYVALHGRAITSLSLFFSSSSCIVFIVIVDFIFLHASSSLVGMCFQISCLITAKCTQFIELPCVH